MRINQPTNLACPWREGHGQAHIHPHSRGHQEADMPQVIDRDELERNSPTSYVFTGERHGASVCVLIADLPPGGGPRLHRHLWGGRTPGVFNPPVHRHDAGR